MNTVLFDMDGVVLNSERQVYSLWKQYLPNQLVDDLWEQCLGVSAADEFKIFQQILNWNEQLYMTFIRLVQSNLAEVNPQPGILTLLSSLKPQCALGLVSSSNLPSIQSKMKGLLSWFDAIVSVEDVKQGKPAPDGYLKAMTKLHSSPKECWVIEDSVNGIIAAHQAGIQNVIYVNDTVPYKPEYNALLQVIPPLDTVSNIILARSEL